MFARRLFVVLFPVVIVAVSMLVMPWFLFAQEGGDVCRPGRIDINDTGLRTIREGIGWFENEREKVTTYFDGSCETDMTCVPQDCDCTTLWREPQVEVETKWYYWVLNIERSGQEGVAVFELADFIPVETSDGRYVGCYDDIGNSY